MNGISRPMGMRGAVGSAIAGITSGQPQTTATPQHQFRVGVLT